MLCRKRPKTQDLIKIKISGNSDRVTFKENLEVREIVMKQLGKVSVNAESRSSSAHGTLKVEGYFASLHERILKSKESEEKK